MDLKKRFSEEQIIGFLKQAEAGVPVKELCRQHGFSDASFYTWRAKFGGKTVSALKAADPNYAYAWDGSNARFNKLMKASDAAIKENTGMSLAIDWAIAALKNKGSDPSNGAFWRDGLDFKTNYNNHPKVRDGFKFGDLSHNIFNVQENKREVIVRWKTKNKKTGQIVDGSERGRYDTVWISTAAHGSTIFWKHPTEYIKATGSKEYR